MAEEKLYYTFEQDTRSFIHQINDLLIRLENSGFNKDVINQIFRCIHSIKSEAAYLKLDEIAEAAHEMEGAIEPLRAASGETVLDSKLLEFCFSVIDGISAQIENIRIPKADEVELSPAASIEDGENLQPVETSCYNDFELMLMNEARGRGERLYKLSFVISEDESMKYPRAYLALSNLEMKYNVINVKPELESLDSTVDGRLNVVLSSSSSDSLIADEINIDQVENIEIFELSYAKELENAPDVEIEEEHPAALTRQRVISVEASEIDAISEYVTEIKSRLADLSTVINDDDAREKLETDLMGLETISSGIERMMTNLQTVDFNAHFAGYRRTVRDLATRLGKKIELVIDFGDMKMLRDFADFIAEPLLQLIRNAVVHGIETPQLRTASGKSETGLIKITAIKNDKLLTVSVADDGQGISIESGDEDDILGLITAPGFSTHNESDDYAGRGVGLDLVRTKILKRNGKLELINRPGEGSEFRMVFAEGKTEVPFLIIRTDETSCAVKNVDGASVFSIKAEDIVEIDGNCTYMDEILFTPDGRFKDCGEKSAFQAFRMSHLGKTGVMVFDESLFEVHYDVDSFSEGFDVGSYCRELIINGKTAEYSLLTPQVLFD